MKSSFSSFQNFWINTYPRTLKETYDYMLESMQRLDESVMEYHKELQNSIESDIANINKRQANLDKWIKRTNGNLPQNQRDELSRISREIKEIKYRNENIDKDVKVYREKLMEDAVSDIFSPQININNKGLASYLHFALSDTCETFDLDSDFRQKILEIENTPLPPPPQKKVESARNSCGCVLISMLLYGVFLIITSIFVSNLTDPKPENLVFVFGIPLIATLYCLNLINQSYKKKIKENEDKYNLRVCEWEQRVMQINELKFRERDAVVEKMNLINDLVESYKIGNKDGVEGFIVATLDRLPKISHTEPILSVEYVNSSFIVNYVLPDIEDLRDIPVDVDIKKGHITLSFIKDNQRAKVYNKLVYDMVLAVIHSVFKYDTHELITNVTVNGIIDTIDKSIGKNIRICACSLQMSRDEFQEINLEFVDSYECFRRHKGVAAANISDKVAIRPIQQVHDNDARFVEGYGVASGLKRGINLATMPWQDFENLIRELFEKLFSKHGGFCKVTRASRDGGVDAIAFNPDPISGGKFIIQAKRYTNLVSPSAVRDLLGTLLHEGANKAILVTTSDYGGDSYAFAKGKPIQLLNGNHLLHYLKEELGMSDVYINLEEAKKINKEI